MCDLRLIKNTTLAIVTSFSFNHGGRNEGATITALCTPLIRAFAVVKTNSSYHRKDAKTQRFQVSTINCGPRTADCGHYAFTQ
jgi:hypothetical protein